MSAAEKAETFLGRILLFSFSVNLFSFFCQILFFDCQWKILGVYD